MKKLTLSIILLSLINAQIMQPMQKSMQPDEMITKILVDKMEEYNNYIDYIPLLISDHYQDMIVNLHHVSRFPAIEIDPSTRGLETQGNYDSSNLKFDNNSFYVNGFSLVEDCLLTELFVTTYAPTKTHTKLIMSNARIRNYIASFIEKTVTIINEENKDKIITLINKFPFFLAEIIKSGIVNRIPKFKEYCIKSNEITLFNEQTFISISPSKDTIRIWDINNKKNKKSIATLKGHNDTISSMMKLNDTTLGSMSYDGVIKMWDMNSFSCKGTLQEENVYFFIKFDDNTLIAHGDQYIKVVDFKTCALKATFDPGISWRAALLKKFDKYTLISCSFENQKEDTISLIKIWDMKSFSPEPIATFKVQGHILLIKKINEDKIVTCSDSNHLFDFKKKTTICIWDMKSFSPEPLAAFKTKGKIQSISKINKNKIISCSLIYKKSFYKNAIAKKMTIIKIWDINSLLSKPMATAKTRFVNLIKKFNGNILIFCPRTEDYYAGIEILDANFLYKIQKIHVPQKKNFELTAEKLNDNLLIVSSKKRIQLWNVNANSAQPQVLLNKRRKKGEVERLDNKTFAVGFKKSCKLLQLLDFETIVQNYASKKSVKNNFLKIKQVK
jgi:WD40 repeat protein